MLKLRIQGERNDIKWFLKILERDKRFILNEPSEPMEIKGTSRYKRVYVEIFRNKDDYAKTNALAGPSKTNSYVGSGRLFLKDMIPASEKGRNQKHKTAE